MASRTSSRVTSWPDVPSGPVAVPDGIEHESIVMTDWRIDHIR
jgi:hypothetical protein